jgi:hypothetical protein
MTAVRPGDGQDQRQPDARLRPGAAQTRRLASRRDAGHERLERGVSDRTRVASEAKTVAVTFTLGRTPRRPLESGPRY